VPACGPKRTVVVCWPGGCQGLRGPRAALHWGGRALNAPTALRCSVLRPHRQTRCVRCALYAQTVAMSMMTNALRAGRKPCAPQRPRGAPHGVPAGLGSRVRGVRDVGARDRGPGPDATHTAHPASRQAEPGGGDFWRAEEHRPRVGARSALRLHSGRICLNEAPAGRAVSYAARPWGEHRRVVGAFSARPRQHEPPPGSACRDARQRQRQTPQKSGLPARQPARSFGLGQPQPENSTRASGV
jgi:hypothetical protein